MITKKYLSESLSEAIETIKKEMGQKASITATRTLKVKKGFLRSAKKCIEVTAKVDESYLTREQLVMLGAEVDLVGEKKMPDPSDGVRVSLSKEAREQAHKAQQQEQIERADHFKKEIEKEAAEIANNTPEPQAETTAQPPPVKDKPVQEETQEILAGIDALLKEQGIADDLIALWHHHFKKMSQGLSQDDLLNECVGFFLDRFIPFETNLPKIASFGGPAGSGKTSLVLKLAFLIKKQKKKVAIFTLDGNLGVIEQMKQAASKMDCPLCVIYQIRSFQNALKEYGDYDHILIDTASVSAKETQEIEALQKRLVQMEAPSFVVLSARDIDNERTVKLFKNFEVLGLNFTRIDELYTAGIVYNLLHKARLPVAYFGIGTKIDEDIETASGERLVSVLFGLQDDGQMG
ncbi:MAG: hypothetical protein HQM16_03325 [Deltaproteobacteria bacterium]|nr:hypothetical protein [Deltaproteobacteria bacterium]